LYYRLNVFPLRVPALRERVRDIVPLARHFAARNGDGRRLQFDAEAEAVLCSHGWPGNVRELENTIQRALILASGDVITAADVVLSTASTRAATGGDSSVTDIRTLERDHILATLKEVGGSRKLAVQRLGISERTLRYKLQQYRLDGVL
jgi:two-component system response regulator FlrC